MSAPEIITCPICGSEMYWVRAGLAFCEGCVKAYTKKELEKKR
jgi:hypothetical protein